MYSLGDVSTYHDCSVSAAWRIMLQISSADGEIPHGPMSLHTTRHNKLTLAQRTLDLTGMKTPRPSRSPTITRHDHDTPSNFGDLPPLLHREEEDSAEEDLSRDDVAHRAPSRKGKEAPETEWQSNSIICYAADFFKLDLTDVS